MGQVFCLFILQYYLPQSYNLKQEIDRILRQQIQMGNQQKVSHQEDTISDLIKQKEEIQFGQKDFIREIEGSVNSQYHILSPALISNQFYQLRKAIHIRTKLSRAVFTINKYKVRSQQRQNFEQQVSKLKFMDNPHLLKVYELFHDTHHFHITCEFCHGLSLAQILWEDKRFPERKVALIMSQLLYAIAECHKKEVIHSDFKLQNIVFDSAREDVLKIIDLSISRIFRIHDIVEQSKKKAFLASPQSLSAQPTCKSDIWSLGMIMYILLCGQPPILGSYLKKQKQKFIFYQLSFENQNFRYVTKQAKALIKQMLQQDPENRPTAEQCLRSPWFEKYRSLASHSKTSIKRVLQQCFNFNPKSKLQQAVWSFYVNSVITFEQKQRILRIFKYLDRDNKGNLSSQDLQEGFSQFQDAETARFSANFIIKRHRGKVISFSDFLTVSTNRDFLINDENNKKIFQIFDDDDSGQISLHELKEILGSSKQVCTQIWIQLMKEADSNSDGLISYEQFILMMEQLKNTSNLHSVQLIKVQDQQTNRNKQQSQQTNKKYQLQM